MFIETVPNRNSPPAVLLRRSFRRNGKTVKETLANLTHWPPNVVAGLERLLQGRTLVAFDDLFRVERTIPHGHVAAVLETIRRLAVDTMIAPRRCRERDLVVAMIAERLLHPCSNSKPFWPTWQPTAAMSAEPKPANTRPPPSNTPTSRPFRRGHSNFWRCVQYAEIHFGSIPLIYNEFLAFSKRNFGLAIRCSWTRQTMIFV